MVLDFQKKYSTDSYPYGRLRCTAYFSVEFKANKGCRTVFQTIDPKNGKLNKPKNSTYSHLVLLELMDNGHYDFRHFDVNGMREMIRTFEFLSDIENFTNANITHEAQKYMLQIAMSSHFFSFVDKDFSTEDEKKAYREKYVTPFVNHIFTMLKGEITHKDYNTLLNHIWAIPMSFSEKKDYIRDKGMIGGEKYEAYRIINSMSEQEADGTISLWSKSEAMGAGGAEELKREEWIVEIIESNVFRETLTTEEQVRNYLSDFDDDQVFFILNKWQKEHMVY